MRVDALLFQVLLISVCMTASLQQHPCQTSTDGPEKCGCGGGNLSRQFSDVWSGEDSEYFYLDDMAFRKPSPGLTLSDATKSNSNLYWYAWPDGLIFYVIDESFKASFQQIILDAMSTIQTNVGTQHLEFRSARTAKGTICRESYLLIERTEEAKCSAEVGRPRAPKFVTKIWLNQDECSRGTILHELLHALGLLHEHCRPDRDTYVTVNLDNIITDLCGEFSIKKMNVAKYPYLNLPYDINSIMHYGSCYFTCNGGYTMVTKNGSSFVENRQELTRFDIQKLQAVYPANVKVPYSEAFCNSTTATTTVAATTTESCSAISVSSVAGLLLSIAICVAMRLLQ